MTGPDQNDSRAEERPWGEFHVIASGPGYQVKRLVVKPGKRLSLQWHQHRDEHWVVAGGVARITVGEEQQTLTAGDSADVKKTVHHRIENPGAEDLVVIELQTGNYLGEDDIVRVQDDFGRADPQRE